MWNAIVVGGGLAGIIAALRAQERGKRVLLISEGVGSLAYSSGVWDFGNISELQKTERHPYNILGVDRIRAGFEYFLDLCPEYIGEWGSPGLVLTPLGHLRQADIYAPIMAVNHLADAARIVLVAPRGLKDFFPEVVRENLGRNFPKSEVLIYQFATAEFESWYRAGQSIKETDYVKFWATAKGQAELQRILEELGSGNNPLLVKRREVGSDFATAVIIPGLSAEFNPELQAILRRAPFPVSQMTAFPPTASGRNIYDALVRKFKRLGGEFVFGSSVVRAEMKANYCTQVVVRSKGKESIFQAPVYVLAGGGILGGDIEVTHQGAREGVFDLPLFVPKQWSKPDFLGEQPYAQLGVEIDERLRPLSQAQGDVVLSNVMVVGRMLAHWDPWVDKCGAGVSLASGYLAGQLV